MTTPVPRRSRGFTLIELLVALAVMAVLAILSWRGIDGMTRAQEQTEARADEVLTLQTALAQWNADLDTVIQLPQITPLDWNGRVMRMTRRGTASVIDGVRVVAWTRREGQWMRWESPPVTTRGDVEAALQQADLWSANPSDDQRKREVSVTPLADWQIFYFRSDSWTNPLSSDAQSTAQAIGAVMQLGRGTPARTTQMPDGVRVVLDLPPGRALSGRLTLDWVNPIVGGGKSQ